jgi:hypothetical protein
VIKLLLVSLAALSLIEFVFWFRPLWPRRRLLATLIIITQTLDVLSLFVDKPRLWTALILLLSAYRDINLLRLIKGRTNPDYLYQVARHSSYLLMLSQLVVLVVSKLVWQAKLTSLTISLLFAVFGLIGGLVLLLSSTRQISKTRPLSPTPEANRDLPTLTVAIPARNETDDLQQCLTSLLASNYPKLEVLVLDDCSQVKKTPQIIRDFAQGGVTFLEGQQPPKHWLAKNFAYDQLCQQANGQLIIFCGVDTRFEPNSRA